MLAFVFNVSESHAFQCLDFSGFPDTTVLPSPVVAPPGETLPSDIRLDYIEDYVPSDDEYYFGEYNTGNNGLTTFLSAQYAGKLRITFDVPRTVGSLIVTTMHFNQPEIEYRLYDSGGIEITSGWVATNSFPAFNQNDPARVPAEGDEYTMSLSGYYFSLGSVKTIELRNLSRKNYFSSLCIF